MADDVRNQELTDSVGVEPRKWTFTIIDNKAIEDISLSVYAKMVYIVLSYFADRGSRTCYPKIETIAKKAGCSPRKAGDAIKELVAAGYLKKKRTRTSSVYALTDKHDMPTRTAPRAELERHHVPTEREPLELEPTNDELVNPEIVNNLVNGIASSFDASSVKPKTTALFKELRISGKDQESHIREYGEDRVLAALEYTKRQGPDNPGGYLNRLLRANAILEPEQQDDEWDPFNERRHKRERQAYLLEQLEEARERKGDADDGGLYRRIKAMIEGGYLDDASKEMLYVYNPPQVYIDGEWKTLTVEMQRS